jgi:hypothetical protein
MKKMKKIMLLITLFLFCCSKKEKIDSNFKKAKIENKQLSTNFREIIIKYQNTYPVKNPRKNNIYIYGASFYIEKKDTVFTITRSGAGIFKNDKNLFGIYSDSELKNFIVSDNSKLSINQVKIYKNVIPDSLIWKSESFPESITPVSKYKIVNKVPKFIKTDTIWNHWD